MIVLNEDPYLLDNGVLRSLLRDEHGNEIRNGYDLQNREALFTQIRLAQILDIPIEGNFDLAHLQRIHHFLFQDLYAWAGVLRTIDIAKDITFVPHAELESQFATIAIIIHSIRNNSNRTQLPNQLAQAHIAINRWHGFREGNGRANRIFIRQLAGERGLDVRFESMSRTEITGAHILANAGLDGQMKSLFRRETRDLRTTAISRLADRRRSSPVIALPSISHTITTRQAS